jgi:hypothetical protein
MRHVVDPLIDAMRRHGVGQQQVYANAGVTDKIVGQFGTNS